VDSSALRRAVTTQGVTKHLQNLQQIATSSNNTRADGTAGFQKSADYVFNQLKAAGYTVTRQSFSCDILEDVTPPVLQQVSSTRSAPLIEGVDYTSMSFSGNGSVTARVTPVGPIVLPPTTDPSSVSGCATADFAGFTAGNIALVQRGTCDFSVKTQNSQAAGASAIVIFNEGNAFALTARTS
jgi:hypothetical protein